MSAAAASAIAAISAGFAGATSIAAWITVRGRRPRLTVVCEVGDAAEGGGMKRNPTGAAIGVRASNVRDADVQVTDLWFESRNPRIVLRWPPFSRARVPIVWPRSDWFAPPPADAVPGTVKSHHTAMYTFRMAQVGTALLEAGHLTYWAVVQVTGGRCFRSRGLTVSAEVKQGPTTSSPRKREIT